MTDDNLYRLPRRKVLAGLGGVGLASAAAGLGTSAYLSDTESFEGNSITAGTLDLKVDWQQTYDGPNGLVPVNAYPDHDGDGLQSLSDENEYSLDEPAPIDLACGDLASGDELPEDVFEAPNRSAGGPIEDQDALISLDDVKPGDKGEITFSLHLCDNPGYVWLNGELVSESENGVTEPEADAANEDDTPSGDMSLWPLAAFGSLTGLGGDGSDGLESQADEADGGDGDSGESSMLRKGVAAGSVGAAGVAAMSGTAAAQSGISVSGGAGDTISAQTMAENLVAGASGISVVGGSATYTGDSAAGGTFSGASAVYGVDEGIILSSGEVEDIVGPNESDGTSTDFDNPGDGDLTAIADNTVTNTNDAAILEFDFEVPEGEDTVYFNYVFGSDEYNEYVDQFNDVFGFFVNLDENTPEEANVATVNGDPVSINTINKNDNSELYNNNDPSDFDDDTPFDTEADGFTDVLQVEAPVNPGEVNTFKLAIADANDHALDAWVLIEGESLGTSPDPEPDTESELPDAVQVRAWYDDGDNAHQEDEEVFIEGTLRSVLDQLSSGNGVPLDGDQGDDFDETGGDPTASTRGCYSASDTHYLGFEWWVPTDVGNEIQSDTATFDLGFYAEQCRNNDGSGASSSGGNGGGT